MTYNMGQLLSIPFVLLGVALIVTALLRKRQEITYPDRWADEKMTKTNKR